MNRIEEKREKRVKKIKCEYSIAIVESEKEANIF
jgi:hypothetical protein